jgi:NADH:ubiquinone oxidoreductase subunit
LFSRLFAWWNGATIGALYDISRRGRVVGEDEQGNTYYEERKPSLDGRPRRWVVYNGYAEPSRIPPDWFGWMHYTLDEPPTVRALPRKAWEKPHVPNLSGTPFAWHRRGSLASPLPRTPTVSDYQPWRPDEPPSSPP